MALNGTFASFVENDNSIPVICFDENNIPYIRNINIDIKVKASNGIEMPVNSVNGVRWLDHLVIYNSFLGNRSETNQWGAEVLCQPQSDLIINGTVVCDILQKEASQQAGTGKMAFSGKQFVLSGVSKAFDYIKENIEVGQKLEFITTVDMVGSNNVKHIVAGSCQVLKNGTDCRSESTSLPESNLILGNDLRSAIGYNQDKTKLYFFTSEKYSDENNGLTIDALIEVMKKYSIYDGICMDGGVNSTLYANNQIVNFNPEDEQEIANGLIVFYDKLTGLNSIANTADILVFPNPAFDKIFIRISKTNSIPAKFELYDIDGKLINTKRIAEINKGNGLFQVNLPSVKTGSYIYRISSQNIEIKKGNIIIQ